MPILTANQHLARANRPASASSSRSGTPTGITKKRSSATNRQRVELRRWWSDDSLGKREHKDAIRWFEEKFGRVLSTSTISDYLSSKYAHLDEKELSNYELGLKRVSNADYKELEEALAAWQLRYDKHPDSGSTTGDLLCLKAREFWEKLPCYAGKEPPKFSNGWLARFKSRYGLKERRRHGEGASAQIDEDSEHIMAEIRKEAAEYGPDNTYNMDESGYYWKMKPDRSLSTFEAKGLKKAKARITANFCCNASGTDKLPPWFIGTAQRPRCFQRENLYELDHLGAVWRSNKSAWMTHHIMKEWLRWFDNRMVCANKKVLLLMDNFSAHELGVEQMIEKGELKNVKVRAC
jgi:DDE superfamily endonuclease/Fission yeast centromere protein N-terminal domain/Tc5 transposase DNA-binding domain